MIKENKVKNGKPMAMEIEMESDSEDKKYGKYEDYEIECAARTLQEAEEIKADSEKMKYVKQYMEESLGNMKKAIGSISSTDDIRKARQKLEE